MIHYLQPLQITTKLTELHIFIQSRCPLIPDIKVMATTMLKPLQGLNHFYYYVQAIEGSSGETL